MPPEYPFPEINRVANYFATELPKWGHKYPQIGLVRIGENVVLRDTANKLVFRVYRRGTTAEEIHIELRTIKCLLAQGQDAPILAEISTDTTPLIVEGRFVTVWKHIPHLNKTVDFLKFGQLVRSTHKNLRQCTSGIPEWDPLKKINQRLALLKYQQKISTGEHKELTHISTQANKEIGNIKKHLEKQTIHGDCHQGNVITTSDGELIMLDFEQVAKGPIEWDLLPTAIAYERFNLSYEDYRQFVSGYGFDVRSSKFYPTLKRLRELSMTTWIAQNRNVDKKTNKETTKRIESVINNDQKKWEAF